MSEILKVQLEDSEGNIYYLKTDASNVYCTDGSTVETKLNSKIDTDKIVNNAATDDINKIVSAAVAKALQDQISQLNNNTTKHGGQFLAGQGASGGYSFLNDGSHDTGLYSDYDGDLYYKTNGTVHKFSSPDINEYITNTKTFAGSGDLRIINCGAIASDGSSFGHWPVYIQAVTEAVQNGARAGIAFHNPGQSAGILFLDGGNLRFCNNNGEFFTIDMHH